MRSEPKDREAEEVKREQSLEAWRSLRRSRSSSFSPPLREPDVSHVPASLTLVRVLLGW